MSLNLALSFSWFFSASSFSDSAVRRGPSWSSSPEAVDEAVALLEPGLLEVAGDVGAVTTEEVLALSQLNGDRRGAGEGVGAGGVAAVKDADSLFELDPSEGRLNGEESNGEDSFLGRVVGFAGDAVSFDLENLLVIDCTRDVAGGGGGDADFSAGTTGVAAAAAAAGGASASFIDGVAGRSSMRETSSNELTDIRRWLSGDLI